MIQFRNKKRKASWFRLVNNLPINMNDDNRSSYGTAHSLALISVDALFRYYAIKLNEL